jgi:uncharacterized protein DUF4232
MRAHLAAACAAVAAVGLLAACSARGGSAAPQATATVTVQATQAGTAGGQPSSQTTPAAPPASPAPPPPAACSTRYLGAKVGASQGATGSTYVVLVFTNLNNYPCTLYGFPGVALDNGKPATPVGLAAAENPATPRELVTLGPHGTASALLRIVHAADYPAAKCNPVTTNWLQIIPPNQYAPIYLGYTTQTCAKPVQILTVDAVRPGSGSS